MEPDLCTYVGLVTSSPFWLYGNIGGTSTAIARRTPDFIQKVMEIGSYSKLPKDYKGYETAARRTREIASAMGLDQSQLIPNIYPENLQAIMSQYLSEQGDLSSNLSEVSP